MDDNRQTIHHSVRMSDKAYKRVKTMAKQPKYKGRGVVGVMDDLVLGEFTTIGSGRVDSIRANKRSKKSL